MINFKNIIRPTIFHDKKNHLLQPETLDIPKRPPSSSYSQFE
jgi:hypothetical protein